MKVNVYGDQAKQIKEGQLSKCNPTDDCFITCMYTDCFAKHQFEYIADRVQMCIILKEQSIFEEAKWGLTDQYLFSCECGNHWVGRKEKAQCSVKGCYKSNKGVRLE